VKTVLGLLGGGVIGLIIGVMIGGATFGAIGAAVGGLIGGGLATAFMILVISSRGKTAE
jgi:hypothetical protein